LSGVSLAKKSMLAALVMLLGYHFLYPHLSHRFYKLGGQERANYVRAQEYIYKVPRGTSAILGSSMSLELNERILGRDYFKLTFPGSSILTSLEVVRRAGKRPRVVLIETNELSKDADSEFLHDLFSPWLSALRRHSPVFKGEGRPANFLVGIASTVVSKSIFWNEQILSETKPDSPASPEGRSSSLFAQVLAIYHEQFNTVESIPILINRINRVADHVDALEQEGATCVFFEMPIDSSLVHLAGPTNLRRMMQKRFPPGKYHWISFGQDHNYETKDGVHLTEEEARNVTEQLVEKVNPMIHQSAGEAND
jgi:hypothetical protein